MPQLQKLFKQAIAFGLVGALNTIITYALYLMLYRHINPTAAMGIGYGLTSIMGLLLNENWVFKAKHQSQLTSVAPRYYLTYALSLVLSLLLTTIWNDWWQFNKTLAPLFSLMVTVPTNFLLSKFWVFKRKDVTISEKTSH
ncbi:GtcA family membrane protein [Lacticaseibacillus saniviri JCM 17471 = DSM 24301]|uniref:GtcA family membrane protein n=1 Tax=Lacticaseibacillus saniviri JCM 17471 = DSM 24301 TaxID=1293598 RepID=A0A0R2MRU4_9LACO|nr:GtcA family membrane protein [Lacticaseibacillus saniviri JCM 17471 = DSM 24301]